MKPKVNSGARSLPSFTLFRRSPESLPYLSKVILGLRFDSVVESYLTCEGCTVGITTRGWCTQLGDGVPSILRTSTKKPHQFLCPWQGSKYFGCEVVRSTCSFNSSCGRVKSIVIPGTSFFLNSVYVEIPYEFFQEILILLLRY